MLNKSYNSLINGVAPLIRILVYFRLILKLNLTRQWTLRSWENESPTEGPPTPTPAASFEQTADRHFNEGESMSWHNCSGIISYRRERTLTDALMSAARYQLGEQKAVKARRRGGARTASCGSRCSVHPQGEQEFCFSCQLFRWFLLMSLFRTC